MMKEGDAGCKILDTRYRIPDTGCRKESERKNV